MITFPGHAPSGTFLVLPRRPRVHLRARHPHIIGRNWLGGLDQWTRNSKETLENEGVIVSVMKFFTVAPSWALRHHPFYFLLFGALFLFVWSLFGGAIAILPIYARDILHVDKTHLGILNAAPNAGALITMLLATRHPPVPTSAPPRTRPDSPRSCASPNPRIS